MRQVFRIGVLMSSLLIAVSGCGSIEWLRGSSDGKGAEGEPRKEDGGAVVRSDGARLVEAQPGQGETQAASVAAGADGRSEGIDVRFAFARWELSDTARAELLRVLRKLQENPKLSVQLEGYADSSGVREKNLQLSQRRGNAGRRFLVEKGVEAVRIRAAALGQLPDGGTEEEREKNRRVTVKLTTDTASR